jgi:hypothetical protein
MWRLVGLVRTDVSGERVIFHLQGKKKTVERRIALAANYYIYCYEREGSVTSKCRFFGLDTEIIGHPAYNSRLQFTVALSTIHTFAVNLTLLLLHTICLYFSQSAVHYNTH